jgi:tetratricopeptide (TPR) repeat protein
MIQNSILKGTNLMPRASDFKKTGMISLGIKIYEKILDIQPRNIDVLRQFAIFSIETENYNLALEILARASSIDRRSATIFYLLGCAQHALGQHKRAILSYKRAIFIKPDFSDAFNNCGVVLENIGKIDLALDSYRRAFILHSESALACCNIANILLNCDDPLLANAWYDRAIKLKADYPEAHRGQADAFSAMKMYEFALDSYDTAIALWPNYAEAYCNRGIALNNLKEHDAAIKSFDKAIEIRPLYADAWCNKGVILGALGRYQEALTAYDRVKEIDPAHTEGNFNRALCHLLLGKLEEGWRGYEARWSLPRFSGARKFGVGRKWTGKESLHRKTILVYEEQGFGDTIQFCRYVPLLLDRGARVILQVRKSLVRLMESLDGAPTILTAGNDVPHFDWQISTMSLPEAFGTVLENIPSQTPYLHANYRDQLEWASRIGSKAKLRVGLVWAGSPPPAASGFSGDGKSISLSCFEPFGALACEFVSLQKGDAEDEIRLLESQGWQGPRLINFADAISDFADTAALIMQLDLVISVDTGVAHLAGSLGKPVWLLNRFDTCWRWFLERHDSPWYPSMRLFRQSTAGDWAGVLSQVYAELRILHRLATAQSDFFGDDVETIG